jgi:hypothetical protein
MSFGVIAMLQRAQGAVMGARWPAGHGGPHSAIWRLADAVQLNPTANGLPGANFAQTLLNWGGQIALWGGLAAILIGAVLHAHGQRAQNYAQAGAGKTTMVLGAMCAGIVGLAPFIVNLFESAGSHG